MSMRNVSLKSIVAVAALLVSCSLFSSANAATITWTQWSTPGAPGTPGSAAGTMGSVGVTYSGDLQYVDLDYPSWTPLSSFTGGTIGNAPPASFNAISLNGGTSDIETISFSQAIVDPVLAIWSLGQANDPTTFIFTDPFTIEAGGPSFEYGGGPLTLVSGGVSGVEGNGVVQFNGTFTSISFTTPQAEHYYDFTVGTAGGPSNSATNSPVPEPSSLALLGTGLLGAAAAARRKFFKA
jgi:hypothetical protein